MDIRTPNELQKMYISSVPFISFRPCYLLLHSVQKCALLGFEVMSTLEDEYKCLAEWNIDGGHFFWVEVRSIGKSMCNDTAYSHRVSGSGGTLICYENNKSWDDHAEVMRFRPSEIGWQSFLMAAAKDNVPPTKLRAIVQHFVVENQSLGKLRPGFRFWHM